MTSGPDRLRVLVVDDHEIVGEGLTAALAGRGGDGSAEGRYAVVGAARTGEEALRLAPELVPDVAVLDLRLPDLPGQEVCRRLRELVPGLAVVVLSAYLTEEAVRGALAAGACAYVTKAAGLPELRAALERVRAGDRGEQPTVSQVMRRLEQRIETRSESGLPTPQQTRVLELVAQGLTQAEVATRLRISESTVRFHLQNLKVKLEAGTTVDLVVRAIRDGLITVPQDEAPRGARQG